MKARLKAILSAIWPFLMAPFVCAAVAEMSPNPATWHFETRAAACICAAIAFCVGWLLRWISEE